jgi:hypothetical protein
MRARGLLIVILVIVVTVRAAAQGPDHALFTAVLNAHVKAGRVDYPGVHADPRFAAYLTLLSATDPASLQGPAFAAFWINAYNAFTLQIVADKYPLESITDLSTGPMALAYVLKTSVWDRDFIRISGRAYTLNDIEHTILRPAVDARVHFALVCAARSCPPLRPEAYTADRLDEQLNDQAGIFLGDERHNRFLPGERRVVLSKIFDWYEDDFKKEAGTLLRYVVRFLPDTLRRDLLSMEEEISVRFGDYDWRLND